MNRIIIVLATLCVLVVAACKPAPETETPDAIPGPAPAPVNLADAQAIVDTDRMMSNIRELSSDAFGGREPMSEGERLTLDLIETRFRQMGLDPLFGDSYRQAVELVSIEADPASVRMTFHMDGKERGGTGALLVQRGTGDSVAGDRSRLLGGWGTAGGQR